MNTLVFVVCQAIAQLERRRLFWKHIQYFLDPRHHQPFVKLKIVFEDLRERARECVPRRVRK